MIGLILSRQLLICLYRAGVPANIVSPIIGLLVLDRCLGYYQSTKSTVYKNYADLEPIIYSPTFDFNISALGPSFIDRPQYWTDNQATLVQLIFDLLKLRQIPILF